MRPDNGTLDKGQGPIKRTCWVALLLDSGQETLPKARLTPAAPPTGNGSPRAVALRQIAPRSASAKPPQDALDHVSMVSGGASGFRFLGRQKRS
jgi:hypothetical protein